MSDEIAAPTPTPTPTPKKNGAKAFFMQNGQFSKTATFATLGTFLVLIAYVFSWFAGTTLTFGEVGTITLPEFDSTAAVALLSILNGTYLGNNLIKSKSVH